LSKKDIKINNHYYNRDTIDYRPIITKIKAEQPDLIFINDYADKIPSILKQADVLYTPKYYVTLLGADPKANTDFTTNIFSKVDTFTNTPFLPNPNSDNIIVINFIQSYYSTYNELPNYDAAYAYDILFILDKVINRCGNIKQLNCVSNELVKSDFTGVLDVVNFDSFGNSISPTNILTFKNGEWISVN